MYTLNLDPFTVNNISLIFQETLKYSKIAKGTTGPIVYVCITTNIAKGTTDPRVEFISQGHSAQFTKLEHITISES